MRRALVVFTMLAAWAGWALPAHASRILTDESGRKVTVPDHPHRVVCLLPSVTDTVFALGSGDDVVAVSDYTTYPPAALKKPSVGSLVKPSIETILSFHPDLVLGTEIPGVGGNRNPVRGGWDTGLSRRPARSCRHPALGREHRRGAQSRAAGGCSQRQPGKAYRSRQSAHRR